MRRRDRPLPRSPAVGTNALRPRATARPTRLSSCGVYPAWQHNARKEPGQKGRAKPTLARPRGPPPTTSRIPTVVRCSSQSSREWKGPGRGRRLWLRSSCPNVAPESRRCPRPEVDAHDQRISFGHERLHQQPQEHATHLPTRPAGTAEDPMVAMESLVLVQAHRAQGRADGSASRSEDGACYEHLNVLEDTL